MENNDNKQEIINEPSLSADGSVLPSIVPKKVEEVEGLESVENTNIDDEIYYESLKNKKKDNTAVIYDGDTNSVLGYFEKKQPTVGYDVENYNTLMAKTQRTIKDLAKRDIEEFKRWKRESNFNPLTKEEKEFEELLKKAGLNYGFNIPGILNLTNSYNGKTSVKITRKTAEINPLDITDEDKIRVAVMGIKDKIKKPTIVEPTNCSPDQALIFLRTATKILLEECDGKFELSDIKIANKAYRDIILKEFEGYRVKASIGEFEGEFNDEHKNVKGQKIKEDGRTESEKLAFDAAYNLLKSVEATRNRLEHSTRFMQLDFLNKKKKNLVDDLNDTFAGKQVSNKLFDDKTVKASFSNLLVNAEKFEKVISGFETVPDNLKEAYSALNLLKETGFNPSSKNRKSSFLRFGQESEKTLKNVAQNLKIVEALILKNTDMDVARLNKNDKKAVVRLGAVHSKLKTAIENNDATKFSMFSDVVKGYDLNNVLNNSNGMKIFPDDATVYKFTAKGEAADVYVFRDINTGTVYEVNGSGNRYDKKEVSNFKFKEVIALHSSINAPKPEAPVEEIKEEIKPEAPVEAPVEMVKPEDAKPAPVEEVAPVVAAAPAPIATDVKYDFSEFDNDNFKEPVDLENKQKANVELTDVEKNLVAVMALDKIPTEKLVELVNVCNCHGKMTCEGMGKVQAEFNQKVESYLKANAPSAENFHLPTKAYQEIVDKVIVLGNEKQKEIKMLDKVFGEKEEIVNKVEKKRPKIFDEVK